MIFYVYIVKCEDDYLYTGITDDIRKRLSQHKAGFSKLTKNRGNMKLVYHEKFSTRKNAAKREKEIKGWRRDKKEQLINNFIWERKRQSSLH